MRGMGALRTSLLAAALVGCSHPSPPRRPVAHPVPPLPAEEISESFGVSTPEEQGVDSTQLDHLTGWIADNPTEPIFSLLISRNGKLIYELYTSSIERDQAHYLMSVTKSFTSAAVGLALDRHLLPATNASVSTVLPRSLFRSDDDVRRFQPVTVQMVLGMSALNAPVPPHQRDADAVNREKEFLAARNRVAFALTQPLLPEPGVSFLYTDITPLLAAGMVHYASGQTVFDFLNANLFGPLGFKNQEWMHRDASGNDNGAYGLRLRPIDMQKFGNLYMEKGRWNGRQLLPSSWVELSFTPWIRSKPSLVNANYGWYWWETIVGPGWVSHEANGWKGQRIAVFPDQHMVVTMTGCIESGDEEKAFLQLIRAFVVPATHADGAALPANPDADARMAEDLAELRAAPSRVAADIESRMIPSVEPREPPRAH